MVSECKYWSVGVIMIVKRFEHVEKLGKAHYYYDYFRFKKPIKLIFEMNLPFININHPAKFN